MEGDNPAKRRAETELQRIYGLVAFLGQGTVNVKDAQNVARFDGIHYKPRYKLVLERIRPSYRIYDLGSGKPLAQDVDSTEITTDAFRQALRWVSKRLWTGPTEQERRGLNWQNGVWVGEVNRLSLIRNLQAVGNHNLVAQETVFSAAGYPQT